MTDNFIQLNKKNTLKIGIKDEDGNILNDYLEFDFNDSTILLKYQEMIEKIQKSKSWLKNQYMIIKKRQDVKGKKLLSKNEEDKLRADENFFKKQTENYNMFLGENGVQKLLNGRKLNWFTLVEIDEIIKNQIEPYLEKYREDLTKKIKEKYLSAMNKEEIEVID